jgi:hypothetical protein
MRAVATLRRMVTMEGMRERVVRSRAERIAMYARVLEARAAGTSPDRLRALAADEAYPVRLYTAQNPRTPADALERLVLDVDVVWTAAMNPSAPERALRLAAAVRMDMAETLVHHPNATPSLRAGIAPDGPDCLPGCRETIHTRPAWREARGE